MTKNKLELGATATDMITGFQGIITGKCTYITGCDQYLLQPKTDDIKKRPEPCWFDENRLKLEEGVSRIILETDKGKGCDISAPSK